MASTRRTANQPPVLCYIEDGSGVWDQPAVLYPEKFITHLTSFQLARCLQQHHVSSEGAQDMHVANTGGAVRQQIADMHCCYSMRCLLTELLPRGTMPRLLGASIKRTPTCD